MSTLDTLLRACQTEQAILLGATGERVRSGTTGCCRYQGHHL